VTYEVFSGNVPRDETNKLRNCWHWIALFLLRWGNPFTYCA